MDTNSIVDIIVAVVCSGAFFSFAQFLLTRFDTKKGIEKKVDMLAEQLAEHKATLARTHILRFADELRNGTKHSDEYFRQQILDIDTYNNYCDTHPNFANGLTRMASEYIREEYRKEYLSNNPEGGAA